VGRLIITCKGKKYKIKNTKKLKKAKNKVANTFEKLIREIDKTNDDEMLLMVLIESKHYLEIVLDEFDEKLGLNGIKEYIELEEVESKEG